MNTPGDIKFLWKHKSSAKVKEGIDNIVLKGNLMHEDLNTLMTYCRISGSKSQFAMVKCGPNDYHKNKELNEGWFVANKDLPIATEYMSVADAQRYEYELRKNA